MAQRRGLPAAAALNSLLYVCGGHDDGTQVFSSVEVYREELGTSLASNKNISPASQGLILSFFLWINVPESLPRGPEAGPSSGALCAPELRQASGGPARFAHWPLERF